MSRKVQPGRIALKHLPRNESHLHKMVNTGWETVGDAEEWAQHIVTLVIVLSVFSVHLIDLNDCQMFGVGATIAVAIRAMAVYRNRRMKG